MNVCRWCFHRYLWLICKSMRYIMINPTSSLAHMRMQWPFFIIIVYTVCIARWLSSIRVRMQLDPQPSILSKVSRQLRYCDSIQPLVSQIQRRFGMWLRLMANYHLFRNTLAAFNKQPRRRILPPCIPTPMLLFITLLLSTMHFPPSKKCFKREWVSSLLACVIHQGKSTTIILKNEGKSVSSDTHFHQPMLPAKVWSWRCNSESEVVPLMWVSR